MDSFGRPTENPGLTANDYDVIQATTAAETMKRVAADAPDVVLLDLGLPDLDGKEVIRRIREWSDVPIVILSARDRETEKIEALDLGADDFINLGPGARARHPISAGLREGAAPEAGAGSEQSGFDLDRVGHRLSLRRGPGSIGDERSRRVGGRFQPSCWNTLTCSRKDRKVSSWHSRLPVSP